MASPFMLPWWQRVLLAKEMIPPNDPALVTMALEALNFDKESRLSAWWRYEQVRGKLVINSHLSLKETDVFFWKYNRYIETIWNDRQTRTGILYLYLYILYIYMCISHNLYLVWDFAQVWFVGIHPNDRRNGVTFQWMSSFGPRCHRWSLEAKGTFQEISNRTQWTDP